jgi:hypothetical protein
MSQTDGNFVKKRIGNHRELVGNSSLTELSFSLTNSAATSTAQGTEKKKNIMATGNFKQYAWTDISERYHKEIQS